ncbi:hypothetical protein CMUS01_13681 [Colletotrichum musicola]|uniref:Uncharacterized protein n=1 Tax=Colletotrichum musicola TaxID=2175873 RepID=A0A8H6MUH6_9PEZI|nr:hypothetical protein CMUS01_13681 [Colletotrichum musicola]
MAIDGSKCPEDGNSTDCLLRDKVGPDHPAFTLIIGLVATAFALATILQAVLVSGKGRRKSGQRAIGHWSKNTKKEWSWSDMSFQVTAMTPILRTHSLLCQIAVRRRSEKRQGWPADDARSEMSSHVDIKASGRGQSLWQTARSWFHIRRLRLSRATPSPAPSDRSGSPTAIGPGSSEISRPSFSSYARNFEKNLLEEEANRAAAAWIGFFEDVGLDQLDLLTAHNGLRLVAADYLPDDLVAAPAYAEVGVVLAAATTAGAQFSNLDPASRFPTIFGRGFQFDFRQHPILGVVGAYSRYEKRDGGWDTPIVEELEATLVLGRGVVDVERGTLPAAPRLRSFHLLDYTGSARSDLRACLQTYDDLADNENAAPMWFDSKARMAPYDFVPFATLLLASTPDYVPALFPKSVLRTTLPLTTLALGGSYWNGARLDAFVEPHLSSWPETSDAPAWRQFVWFDFDMPRKSLEEGFSRIDDRAHSAFFTKCMRLVTAGVSATLEAREREAEADAEEEAAAEAAASAPEEARAEAVKTAQEATLNASRARRARREVTRAYETAKDGVKGRATKGYLVVLQLCLKLLHKPDDFEEWFLKASSGTRRALRCATLQQMQQVDTWLHRHGRSARMKQRAIALNTMTAVLSKVEEMVKNGRLAPLRETVGAPYTEASETDAGQKHEVLDGQCRWEDVATLHHSDLLQTLRSLLDDMYVDDTTSNTTRERPVETPVLSNSWDERIQRHGGWLTELTGHQATYRSGLAEMNLTLENLGAVVVANSEWEDNWPLWNRYYAWRDEETRDIDDIIIYRTLMMYKLFITAQDSSEIVESGLWDHVVPII